MFNEILELLNNGHWTEAIKQFRAINPTARDYQDYLDTLDSLEDLRDLALLGFYARDYTGGK